MIPVYLILGDRSSCESIPPLSPLVYLPTSIRGPCLSPGGQRRGTPHWPGCVMVLEGNVLCLRSGLDQVAVPTHTPPAKACVAFGLSVWFADEATHPQEHVLITFLISNEQRKENNRGDRSFVHLSTSNSHTHTHRCTVGAADNDIKWKTPTFLPIHYSSIYSWTVVGF